MSSCLLLSGGMDSVALAYWKRPAFAFTLDYGQKPAEAEIRASISICQFLGIQHEVLKVDCSHLGSGDLVEEKPVIMAPSTEWWPYRNQLLVTLACMKAVSMGIKEMLVGSVKSDAFHKDGTGHFYELLNALMKYQEGEMQISAPALHLYTHELILTSKVPSHLLFYAHSCHKSNTPCGHCRGCYKYIETVQKLKHAAWK